MRTESRPLTDAERTTLERLFDDGTSLADRLRDQLRDATVIGRCGCGCPSVYLRVGGRPNSADVVEELYERELRVVDAGDEFVADILLFLKADTLHYLEYASYSDAQPESWPDPSRLRPAP